MACPTERRKDTIGICYRSPGASDVAKHMLSIRAKPAKPTGGENRRIGTRIKVKMMMRSEYALKDDSTHEYMFEKGHEGKVHNARSQISTEEPRKLGYHH